ncbi:MAG: YaaL family protein [Lachnospiraceae bacterium]|nr:YaaL family protein [Lachnospiraceae bacterium]
MKTGYFSHRKQRQDLLAEGRALRAEIERTRCLLEAARNHFEQVVDPTLIDCYIYELNAAQLRYQFLLRRFKRLEEPIETRSVSLGS